MSKGRLKTMNGEIGAYKKANHALLNLNENWRMINQRTLLLGGYVSIGAFMCGMAIWAFTSRLGIQLEIASMTLTLLLPVIGSVSFRVLKKGDIFITRNSVLRFSQKLRTQKLKKPYGELANRKFSNIIEVNKNSKRKIIARSMAKAADKIVFDTDKLAHGKLTIHKFADGYSDNEQESG